MGKASSSKKVARAASTGGGRTSRGRTPWLWYGSMTMVVLLGTLILWVSRADLDRAAADPPVIGKDHWHAAYGIFVCDKFLPDRGDVGPDRLGIHSHSDGLIHIHPFASRSSGKNARLGIFMDQIDVDLSRTRLELPDQEPLVSGESKCGDKVGEVKVRQWNNPGDEAPTDVTGDPNDLRLRQAQVITIAFVPDGTDIPKPRSAGNVNNPSDLGETPQPAPETTVPTTAPPTSEAPPTTGSPTTAPAAPPPPPGTSVP